MPTKLPENDKSANNHTRSAFLLKEIAILPQTGPVDYYVLDKYGNKVTL